MLHVESREIGRWPHAGDLAASPSCRVSAPALLLAAIFLAAAAASPAQSSEIAKVSETGVFAILSAQRRVGTEKFRIAFNSSGAEVTGELDLDAPSKVSETCSLKLDSNLRPVSYERVQKSPKKGSIAAEFGPQQSRLVSKTAEGTGEELFYFHEQLVVLDTNFFHHYAILLRQYKAEQGGVQQFNVFVPQEATPGTISLELKGQENQTVGKTARELNHFQAVTDQVQIDIWAAPDGQIYRIAIPQANLEVVRQ